MCQVLQVSVSGYYAWRGRPESERDQNDRALTLKITICHKEGRETYGTPRIRAALAAKGELVSRRRIGRLMKAANLVVRCKRKFRTTTRSNPSFPVAPNVLNREFTATAPNQKWVTDITYLPTTEGWLYLATVMDLYSRKIVGWALHERLLTPLVLEALTMAQKSRRPVAGMVHHSDRGSQYASEDYRQALQRLEAVQSMSGVGDCWDNAVKESFFSTLKMELNLYRARGTRVHTRTEVFEWIEVFYNRQRRHSSLGYCSPVAFEERALNPN